MFYPIVLEVAGRDVLVVGGGNVAVRKVRGLLGAGAHVRVIAREANDELVGWAETDRIDLHIGEFAEELLGNPALVFAATDDPRVNDRVVRAAREQNVFANSAVGREQGFVLPAVHRTDGVGVAVWSGSPALSKRLRDELVVHVDERWSFASRVFGMLRIALDGRGSVAERGAFWRNLAAGVPQEFRTVAVAKRFVRAVALGAGLPIGKAEADALFEVAEQ